MPSSTIVKPVKSKDDTISYDINLPYTDLTEDQLKNIKYPAYLPTWDKIWFDPLPQFDYEDPALRVKDTSLPNLRAAGARFVDIQPAIGTTVEGLQLNTLNDAAKDELAWLISYRKVVSFANQDMIDDGPAKQEAFMRYFGKPNYQPVSGTIKDHPAFHVIHRDGNAKEIINFLDRRLTTCLWHQDVSYEIQPPGYVMLGLLEGPEVGGDTVFAAADTAYKRLSPAFRAMLDELRVVHSSAKMINHARATGQWTRKDPVNTIHPLIRVHPVTCEKSLFINGEFITKVIGLRDAEAACITDFLMQHIMSGHDFQARVRWAPRSIVMFDNRNTVHSAIVDYFDENFVAKPRHIFRLCAMTEKPIPAYNTVDGPEN